MFKITQSQSYTWPVKLALPVSGGKHDPATFDAEFKRLSLTQLEELLNREDSTYVRTAREILIGWKGVLDDQNAEVPFSETTRDALLEVPSVAAAIVQAFIASHSDAKRKNS